MAIKTLKNLSVPEESDCVFTKPDFRGWPSVLEKNKHGLRAVDGRGISRSELVNIAAEYTAKIGLPVSSFKGETSIILTGHQPNWHHCGIFAKNVIADKFARAAEGIAVQLVLDHDICCTSMSLPEYDKDGTLKITATPMEQKHQDIPIELRDAPCEYQLKKFINIVSKNSTGSFCSEIWQHHIIENMRACKSVADTITQLQARLNRGLGLEIMYLPISRISQSYSFFDFVCSIICNAAHFIRVYNNAISDKRKVEALKPSQTLRTLKIDYLNNIIELPFWLVWQTGKRTSLYASLNERYIEIGTADNTIGIVDSSENKSRQLNEILTKNKCMIRPKAVTLTLFNRLHLADLFIHGTGAENYEYITDNLIRDYYKISNVDFGVATASMTLPAGEGSGSFEISKEVLNYREFFFGLFARDRLEKLICSADERK